jgi:hypothetical protein
MARKTIFVSDLTGKSIDEKDAATVRQWRRGMRSDARLSDQRS